MKFTTYIPTTANDGTPFDEEFLERVIEQLWETFNGMTDEGVVKGRWKSPADLFFCDTNRRISIECERERLLDAIRVVKRAGRRLDQEAMYFEVSGYDGVQFLSLERFAHGLQCQLATEYSSRETRGGV